MASLVTQECRPSHTLRFAVNGQTKQGNQEVSISITPGGHIELSQAQGTPAVQWVSLSGVIWTRDLYQRTSTSHSIGQITPKSDWKNHDLSNAPKALVARKHGNLCILSGELQGNTWLLPEGQTSRQVAVLPTLCRPASRLVFSTPSRPDDGKGEILRVDLHPDGAVEVVSAQGRALQTRVVLDGITFSTVKGTKLDMEKGYEAWGKVYDVPQSFEEHGICHLQGMVRGKLEPGLVTKIPKSCRPQKTLTFNSANNKRVEQLDVTPNGEVWLRSNSGGKDSFVSLSGITFPIPVDNGLGELGSCD